MIFENMNISDRQKRRISFWYVFGAGIVFLPTLLLRWCKESMMPCLIIGYLLFLTMTMLKQKKEKKNEMNQKKKNPGMERVREWGKRCYCFVEGAGLLYALLKLILYRLVPQENEACIFFLLLFLVLYASWDGLECYARGAEVLFVPWLLAILFSALTLYLHIFTDGFFTTERMKSLLFPFSFEIRCLFGVLLSFFVFWRCHFCFERGNGSLREKAFPGAMLILLMAGAVLFHGIEGMKSTSYEMLSLVYTGRGNTLLTSLWILGILYAAGYDFTIAVFSGSKKKLEDKTKKSRVFLVKLGTVIVFGFAVLLTHGKKPVSIESRSYATVECVSKGEETELLVHYLFPETKEGKKESCFSVHADSLEQAEQWYQENSDRSVDFRHLQCVILEEDLVRDKRQLGRLISEWKNEGKYERNAYVFICHDMEEILRMEAALDHPLGQYLREKMTKLNQMEGLDTMRLGTMMDLFYEDRLWIEEICLLGEGLQFMMFR